MSKVTKPPCCVYRAIDVGSATLPASHSRLRPVRAVSETSHRVRDWCHLTGRRRTNSVPSTAAALGRLESARATKYCTGRATNDARDRVRRRIVNDAMKQTTREVGATANTPHHPAQTVDKPRALSPRQATRRTSRFPCPCPAVSPCRPMFLTRAGHSIPTGVSMFQTSSDIEV